MRGRRGRVSNPPAPPSTRLEFGVHQVCPWCKGKGRRVGKKELCGGCDGSGIYARPEKETTEDE